MQKIMFAFYFAITLLLCNTVNGQKTDIRLTENSVVKDTAGAILPYAIWNQLLTTGRYAIKPENQASPNTAFIISRLSEAAYENKLATMPPPRESKFFRKGEPFLHFRTTDINGNKINTKNLSGKILVLNFWFINCPPCRSEIPSLNRLAEEFKADSTIVFYAIALDLKAELNNFLKRQPFSYTIIDDGRSVSSQYSINSYPTNVVVSPEGKIAFHSTGYGINTVPWIKKTVDELKSKMVTQETKAAN